MTRLFRSKSCVLSRPITMFDDEEEDDDYNVNQISTKQHQNQFPILAILLEAFRKSLVTCATAGEDHHILSSSPPPPPPPPLDIDIDIGWPTDVAHVSHVTFDRFNGFLGLPLEFHPQLPIQIPSASVSVFGVSAESMQCSYDNRGNSVPTILLLMQKRLYSEGGLVAEGIFRINAENSQEECVRNQLNRGLVPYGIDVHCLAGLIKAWFRELPKGVLDFLTPDQVMNCNTEEECTQVVSFLPLMEAALLDWAINLMVDVVQHEHQNKMNAHNIAMVFAPNMTQMADPLTALLHAVQVMNFLKTLILKALREREESAAEAGLVTSCSDSPNESSKENSERIEGIGEATISISVHDRSSPSNGGVEGDNEDSFHSFRKQGETKDEAEVALDNTRWVLNGNRNGYSNGERLSWRKGVKKLCRHPVFQLSKAVNNKAEGLGNGEAWI